MRHALCFAALLVVLLAAALGAQDRAVRLADARAPIPGATVRQPLPPSATQASRGRAAQMPGWPVTVGGHGTYAPKRGVVFADLDGDGPHEVIHSSTDGLLYAWDFTATALPGFPVNLNGPAQEAPSVGDLDGDGRLEIVQTTRGLTSGGRLWIVGAGGQVLPGFPKSFNNNNLAGSPTLRDLDDDGELEILIAERAWPAGFLHVVEMDGTEWGGGWPVALDAVPTGSAAVGDVDGDGTPEIAYLSYDSLFLLRLDGSPYPGWPVQPANANFSYQSPALADLDGDGDLEIVVGAHQSAAGYYVYEHDGSLRPGWPRLVGTWTYCPPTVADLEGDGSLEILGSREGTGIMPSAVLYAWTAGGVLKPGFPVHNPSTVFGGGGGGPVTAGDVDGDGRLEVFVDHNVLENGQGFLIGVDATGNDLPGFPLRPAGFTYMNGATLGDVDGDGDVELGVVSFEGAVVDVNLYDLAGPWHPRGVAWEAYHQNHRRGGLRDSQDHLQVQGLVARGATPTVWITGEPGERAWIWADDATALARHALYGWFHLDNPPRRTLLAGAVLPAAGEIALSVPIPNSPPLQGIPIYLQGLTAGAGGGSFTNLLGRVVQ